MKMCYYYCVLRPIIESQRIGGIEKKWCKPLNVLFYDWHWKDNLRHREIAEKINIPRPTVTRWFKQFKIPTQSCTRFTNLNLLNTGLVRGPVAKPKIKKEFPWRFNKEFFKTWSFEMSYILGFLFADGYVFKNPRGSCYFCFISTDKEIIVKIRNILQSNHKIGIRKKGSNWKDAYVLQIGSKKLFRDLNKFGIIQNKSLVINFPDVPKKYLGHFVRGYFDGDGSVNLGKYWRKDRNKWKWEFTTRFTSGSKRFIESLQNRLKKYMLGGYMYKKRGGYELVFARHDSVALYNLMYDNVESNVFLERKYNKFIKAFKVLKLGAWCSLV